MAPALLEIRNLSVSFATRHGGRIGPHDDGIDRFTAVAPSVRELPGKAGMDFVQPYGIG